MPAEQDIEIRRVDPRGADALALLREAAVEARALYPDVHAADAPWPTNEETPARGVYLIAYRGSEPLACGALRPLDDEAVEVRRLYVRQSARRQGLAQAILEALEDEAGVYGYRLMRLETGERQAAAMALYEAAGFRRIPPFGPYVHDPISVCFEKALDDRLAGA